MPALAVSALISSSPTLLYFGQDVGEDGSEETGFGDPSRTSIFDYVGVPAHQRFMNGGLFDGGRSTQKELELREYYEQIMNIAAHNEAINGEFISLHKQNLDVPNSTYSEQHFAFARVKNGQGFIVVSNFSENDVSDLTLTLPQNLLSESVGSLEHSALEPMLPHEPLSLNATENGYTATLSLKGLETKVFSF